MAELTWPATHLHAAGRAVSVINPTPIRYAGIMRGRGNKTDKTDARLIAAYVRDQDPQAPVLQRAQESPVLLPRSVV
jgi:transposase